MSATNSLSKEIAQSAQKILKHLNEIEGENSGALQEDTSDFISLLSTLQTEESANLLQDVSRWTEARKSEYQKYEKPLLNQVEKNQSILEHATNDAIPELQSRMDDFDLKLTSAKSHLVSLSESVVNTAQSTIDSKNGKEKTAKPPQLQLETAISARNLNNNQNEIEEEAANQRKSQENNEVITQLKLRQEHFMSALQQLNREMNALKVDLQSSKEYSNSLEVKNKNLENNVKRLEKKAELLIGGKVDVKLFDSTKKELSVVEDNHFVFELPLENDENQNNDEEKDEKEREIKVLSCENFVIEIEPLDDYVLVPKSEYNPIPNSEDVSEETSLQNGEKWEKFGEVQKNGDDDINSNEKEQSENGMSIGSSSQIVPSEIAGEISYEIRTNEKGEVCFLLSDGSGLVNVSPEFAEEMQNELQKDLQHLIQLNTNLNFETAYAETITNDQYDQRLNRFNSQFDRSDAATTPTSGYRKDNLSGLNSPRNRRESSNQDRQSGDAANQDGTTIKPFTVRATDPGSPDHSIENRISGSKNYNPDMLNGLNKPQPIMPIGIRQKEGDNGFRLFFRDKNDAIVVDANVKKRTKDGLIILNTPSPSFHIRIENGFAPEFAHRCRENPNFHFILQPYRPEGTSRRIVGLCDNKSRTMQPNFFRDTRSTACVWSSFPVRPPPLVCRSNFHRPLNNNLLESPRRSQNIRPFMRNTHEIYRPKAVSRGKSPDSAMIHRKNNVSFLTVGNI